MPTKSPEANQKQNKTKNQPKQIKKKQQTNKQTKNNKKKPTNNNNNNNNNNWDWMQTFFTASYKADFKVLAWFIRIPFLPLSHS